MPREKLRETLQELRQELAAAAALDDASRRLLEGAIEDIQKRLERAQAPEAVTEEPPSLIDELREAVRGFEVSHPTLAGVIGRTIDLLAQSGI